MSSPDRFDGNHTPDLFDHLAGDGLVGKAARKLLGSHYDAVLVAATLRCSEVKQPDPLIYTKTFISDPEGKEPSLSSTGDLVIKASKAKVCRYFNPSGSCSFNFLTGRDNPIPSLAHYDTGESSINSSRYHHISCGAAFFKASDETIAERQTKCDQYDDRPRFEKVYIPSI